MILVTRTQGISRTEKSESLLCLLRSASNDILNHRSEPVCIRRKDGTRAYTKKAIINFHNRRMKKLLCMKDAVQ